MRNTDTTSRTLVTLLAGMMCWWAAVGCAPIRCGGGPDFPRWGWFRKKPTSDFVEPQKYSLYVSPRFGQLPPRRVIMVPTGTESGRYQVPHQFAEVMSAAIRAAGLTEVVLPQGVECPLTVDRILAGQFEEREVVELARAWRGDSIMFIRVNHLQSFAPLSASVTAVLVDVNDAVVVFAVDGHWDVSNPEIRAGFEHFLKNRTHGQTSSQEKLRERSPNQLFAYIAHQITCAWSEAYASPVVGHETFNRSGVGKE